MQSTPFLCDGGDDGSGRRPRSQQQPDVVRVVEAIPLTDWHRPIAGRLPEDGLGRNSKACPVWYREESTGRYRTLTDSARTRLVGGAGSTLPA